MLYEMSHNVRDIIHGHAHPFHCIILGNQLLWVLKQGFACYYSLASSMASSYLCQRQLDGSASQTAWLYIEFAVITRFIRAAGQ